MNLEKWRTSNSSKTDLPWFSIFHPILNVREPDVASVDEMTPWHVNGVGVHGCTEKTTSDSSTVYWIIGQIIAFVIVTLWKGSVDTLKSVFRLKIDMSSIVQTWICLHQAARIRNWRTIGQEIMFTVGGCSRFIRRLCHRTSSYVHSKKYNYNHSWIFIHYWSCTLYCIAVYCSVL